MRPLVALAMLALPASAQDASRGAEIYAEACASCHGAELEGAPDWRVRLDDGTMPAPPHDETGHTWHHGDALLFEYTKLGGAGALAKRGITGVPSAMPAFEDVLTDEEIREVLAFIRSTWSEEIRAVQAERTAMERAAGG